MRGRERERARARERAIALVPLGLFIHPLLHDGVVGLGDLLVVTLAVVGGVEVGVAAIGDSPVELAIEPGRCLLVKT